MEEQSAISAMKKFDIHVATFFSNCGIRTLLDLRQRSNVAINNVLLLYGQTEPSC